MEFDMSGRSVKSHLHSMFAYVLLFSVVVMVILNILLLDVQKDNCVVRSEENRIVYFTDVEMQNITKFVRHIIKAYRYSRNIGTNYRLNEVFKIAASFFNETNIWKTHANIRSDLNENFFNVTNESFFINDTGEIFLNGEAMNIKPEVCPESYFEQVFAKSKFYAGDGVVRDSVCKKQPLGSIL